VTSPGSRRAALVLLAIAAACVGCDHAAKHVARSTLDVSGAVAFASETVRFELAQNPGVFLSFGAGAPAALRSFVLLGLVPVALALVCALAWRAGFSSGASLVGLALVAGGGAANWLDRLLHGGAVTDFVSLGLGPVRTGIFNLADVHILAGAALLLLAHARRREPGPRGAGPAPGGAE
jgi:signal peptidase II